MAITAKLYGNVYESLFTGKINLATDTLHVVLVTSAYTPNQDTDQFLSSAIADEVVGTGYTAGGAALTGVTYAYDAASNTLTLDANDVTWANSSITARYALVVDYTPATDATRPLIGYVDFGVDEQSVSAPFEIVWDAAGISTFTVA